MPNKRQKKKKTNDVNYIARDKKANQAQAVFNRLCRDIASGKYTEPIVNAKGDAIPPETITTDNFTMCYKNLPTSDIFYMCRKQLPKYWFISRDGKIITLYNNTPIWYTGNSEGRTEDERQASFSEQNDCTYKGDRLGRRRTITVYNYTLVAVIYGSLLIANEEQKRNIRKYGFEVFGLSNSGQAKNEVKANYFGAKGLKIKGRIVVEAKDIIETHHEEEGCIIAPELLELMPRWLHEKCAMYTASVNTVEEFEKLIRKSKECSSYLDGIYPDGYTVIDNSKRNNPDIYIHYWGINKKKTKEEGQVESKDYKYFAIVPSSYFSDKMKARIKAILDSIALQIMKKEACYYVYFEEGKQIRQMNIAIASNYALNGYPFFLTYFDKEGNKKGFTIAYRKGNIDNFRRLLYTLKDNQSLIDAIGQELEDSTDAVIFSTGKEKNLEIVLLKQALTEQLEKANEELKMMEG